MLITIGSITSNLIQKPKYAFHHPQIRMVKDKDCLIFVVIVKLHCLGIKISPSKLIVVSAPFGRSTHYFCVTLNCPPIPLKTPSQKSLRPIILL